MKTLKFKLYNHKRNRYLKRSINAAGNIYNHCIALHKRYYRMWGKHISCAKLQAHIAKRRRKNPYWQLVGSQALQDICQRIEKGYQLFFTHHKKGVRPPTFKKSRKYKSFTRKCAGGVLPRPPSALKQAGYKFLGGNRIQIGSRVYQFWNSRPIEGVVKTVTVKRTALGELFIGSVPGGDFPPDNFHAVVVDNVGGLIVKAKTGKIAGFDFGLKTFLTCSEGFDLKNSLFFKQSLSQVKKANREHSKKQKGSANREQARKNLVRKHEDIANRRADWFWKLAHRLTDQFDVLCFETLNLKGMHRLWGRKVNDLAFRDFLNTLEWVAKKTGKQVVYIDRWYPSSKTCSGCGHVLESLDLLVRRWRCPACQAENDRDKNASTNIKTVGISTIGLGNVRQAQPAIAA